MELMSSLIRANAERFLQDDCDTVWPHLEYEDAPYIHGSRNHPWSKYRQARKAITSLQHDGSIKTRANATPFDVGYD